MPRDAHETNAETSLINKNGAATNRRGCAVILQLIGNGDDDDINLRRRWGVEELAEDLGLILLKMNMIMMILRTKLGSRLEWCEHYS